MNSPVIRCKRQLAIAVGYSESHLSRIESNDRPLDQKSHPGKSANRLNALRVYGFVPSTISEGAFPPTKVRVTA
jgi:hypothetical protein